MGKRRPEGSRTLYLSRSSECLYASAVGYGDPERPGGFEPPRPPWQGGRLPGYIMDAFGPRASRRSHELPDSNRLLQMSNLVLKPISEFVCYDRRARLPVPAAGLEPAAFTFSA